MRVTKYIITSPEADVLPSDIAMKIYASGQDVQVKETCFGVIIDGEEEIVDPLIAEIRNLDPNSIFIKDRGFPPGDPRRCRAHRGGGARPGFFMMECESKTLPLISRALACESRGEEIPPPKSRKEPVKLERLEALIDDEFS